jgi:hypothetical protein
MGGCIGCYEKIRASKQERLSYTLVNNMTDLQEKIADEYKELDWLEEQKKLYRLWHCFVNQPKQLANAEAWIKYIDKTKTTEKFKFIVNNIENEVSRKIVKEAIDLTHMHSIEIARKKIKDGVVANMRQTKRHESYNKTLRDALDNLDKHRIAIENTRMMVNLASIGKNVVSAGKDTLQTTDVEEASTIADELSVLRDETNKLSKTIGDTYDEDDESIFNEFLTQENNVSDTPIFSISDPTSEQIPNPTITPVDMNTFVNNELPLNSISTPVITTKKTRKQRDSSYRKQLLTS